jgi:hypothetical protein
MQEIAKELGVSESALWCWLQGDEAKAKLWPVRLVEAAATSSGSLVLVTPGGYRLEGLNVLAATEVLRQLRC